MTANKVILLVTLSAFFILKPSINAQDSPMGKTWLVFIENSSYENLPDLKGPSEDAKIIKTTLIEYRVNNIIHKINMSRSKMLDFFSGELPELLSNNKVNSLLIWYAGHGKYDEKSYWLPVDAIEGEAGSYIETVLIATEIGKYKGLKHILLVNDASGAGLGFYSAKRRAPAVPTCDDAEAFELKSAQLFSSSGREDAADDSQFAEALAAGLNNNDKGCITIEALAGQVTSTLTQGNSQKPRFGVLFGSEHEGGTFFFIRKE